MPGKPFVLVAVLASLGVLLFGAAVSGASTRLLDCGKLTAGIGGPNPKGVPTNATPEVRAFRVAGSLRCSTVHSVMQKFENNASSTLTFNLPPAPGWKCAFSSKARGYVCRNGRNVLEDQLVYKLHGHNVGPPLRSP